MTTFATFQNTPELWPSARDWRFLGSNGSKTCKYMTIYILARLHHGRMTSEIASYTAYCVLIKGIHHR
jgi:hypothetical protein